MKRKLIAISAALLLGLSGMGLFYTTSIFATDRVEQETVTGASTATFSVENMTCASCPITVSKAMSRVEGVKNVDIDFRNKLATVTFDPTIANPDQIAEASTSIGYPASLTQGSE